MPPGVRRRPQVLLDVVPAGPRVAVGDVGLAQVELGIEVTERFGDGLDALPVHTGFGVDGAGGVVVAGDVSVGERLGRRDQAPRLLPT